LIHFFYVRSKSVRAQMFSDDWIMPLAFGFENHFLQPPFTSAWAKMTRMSLQMHSHDQSLETIFLGLGWNGNFVDWWVHLIGFVHLCVFSQLSMCHHVFELLFFPFNLDISSLKVFVLIFLVPTLLSLGLVCVDSQEVISTQFDHIHARQMSWKAFIQHQNIQELK
jgi:hypothetical protein